ncbi:MAG: 2-dehydro-3-deoxygalactonokinase [Clostridia bacterium]|nr:2-dehydro-3-deoxygalactonokinase [Clostridia bacterium]
MAIYITVDGGTTNTRLYLVCDGAVKDSLKLSSGSKSGIDVLKASLREGISDILSRNCFAVSDVSCVIASGMITSEYGLCPIDHVTMPAGKRELHETMFRTSFEELPDIPWYFIRGVKSGSSVLGDFDMMRGEETELMGIIKEGDTDALYILPGSHSKHIRIDENGKIVSIKTMLSGELFAAVMEHTILKDAADFDHNTISEEYLKLGYEYAAEHGVNEAMFKTRILKNIFGAKKDECYSFLMGVVLSSEVTAVIKSDARRVVIGGQKQFRRALAILLGDCTDKNIITLSDKDVDASTALGAVSVYEYKA